MNEVKPEQTQQLECGWHRYLQTLNIVMKTHLLELKFDRQRTDLKVLVVNDAGCPLSIGIWFINGAPKW